MTPHAANAPAFPITFGAHLRLLRRRARLTQAELSIAVGYSEAQICRLEMGRRAPDLAALVALFFPALAVEADSDEARRLLALAADERTPVPITPTVPLVPVMRSLPTAALPNLPVPDTRLIGRDAERAALVTLLAHADTRLVTLVGPPGVGKTRLAIEVAHGRAAQGGTVVFVDLTPLTDAQMALVALAQALECALPPGDDPLPLLVRRLNEQPRLLVLDNLEQLPGIGLHLATLLAQAAPLTLLATSQTPLHLRAERCWQLAPLAVPDLSAALAPAALLQIAAVALLVERLQRSNPAFVLNQTNALAVAAICVRVDGLPLALELVAARGRLLSPHELLTQVAQHHQALTRRTHDVPARHRSLVAALGWSYALLSQAERQLFLELAVFNGGWRLDMAHEVVSLGGAALLDASEALLDHSLVQCREHATGSRLAFLTLIREWALERQPDVVDVAALRRRHAEAYTRLAEAAEQTMRAAGQAHWLARLDPELDNLRAALQWTLGHDAPLGLRLASALETFWFTRGRTDEGSRWLEALLAAVPAPPQANDIWAKANLIGGILAYRVGAPTLAQLRLGVALAAYQALGDRVGEARTLNNLGNVAFDQQRPAEAAQRYSAALVLRRELAQPNGIASALNNLGLCQKIQQCWAEAHATFSESLALYRDTNDLWSIASVLGNLGSVALSQEEYHAAAAYYSEGQAMRREIGDRPGVALMDIGLGAVAVRLHELDLAATHYQAALEVYTALAQAKGSAECLLGLAHVATRQAQWRVAVRLLGSVATCLATLPLPLAASDQQGYERLLNETQQALLPAVWRAAFAAGRALSLADAGAEAHASGAA